MDDRRRNPHRFLRTAARVAPAVLIVFGARGAAGQLAASASGGESATVSLKVLAPRPAGPAPLTTRAATRDESLRLLALAADRVAPPLAAPTLTAPGAPCTGMCTPPRIRENECEDADRDGRCDLVFDPSRQGGFWRALGRYLLLGWLWDRGDDR